MIITRTPFRLPLGGGGTDFPSYYSKNGGFIFSVAINKYMYISINKPIVDELIRIHYSTTEIVEHTDMVQHPLVRESLKHFNIKNSIEVASMADVPAGTGLGSSSSFLIGLLNGLHALERSPIPVQALAEEACSIELDVLKKPIGKQDQYLAAFGGFCILDIAKNGRVKVSQAKISDDTLEELSSNVMLFYTGISRDALSILGEQSARAKKNGSAVQRSLTKIKEIGIEIKKVLEKGQTDEFGKLLHEHWMAKKKMSTKISGPKFDQIYNVARKHGALGGKIIGAGGGGFFMFYCSQNKKKLRESMKKCGLLEMKYDFDFEGSKVLVDFLSHGRRIM